MRKAYDTILQVEVSADLAAQNSDSEMYRYECACCGEEVYLAAAHSFNVIPHFKHHSGNNDTECENYLGQYGAMSTDLRSRKSKSEKAEFYFDKSTKMFNLSLRFSEEEINAYEKQTTTFELKTSAQAQEKAFLCFPVNNKKFTPDLQTMMPIRKFSYNYFLSNTLNEGARKYEVFKYIGNNNNAPTFFKLQGSDDLPNQYYKAKLVRSGILYTNVPYFVAFQNQYRAPLDQTFPAEMIVDDTFRFETMGRKFLGKILTIKTKTANIDALILSLGYQLEASETLTLLWPPAALVDGVSKIAAHDAFLYSSFELQAHGNINVRSEDIVKGTNGISKILIKPNTKIYKKNVEIIIDKDEKHLSAFKEIFLTNSSVSAYTVPDDSACFICNRSGVKPLRKGQLVFLTPQNEIRRYDHGYLTGRVYLRQREKLTGKLLLNDILAHYKQIETFGSVSFSSYELSETASRYLDECKTSGLINTVAKRFIKEGWL
jgi:hypothetical protein